jgi:hypothetical protein
VGRNAIAANATGDLNVGAGKNALLNATGSGNLGLGANAGKNLTTGTDNVDIASSGKAGDSGMIRIGGGNQTATFIAGISTTTLGNAAQHVVIKNNGQLGVATGSAGSSANNASADRALRAKVNRLERAVRQLRAEVKQGR